jgi:hypothetical protein
VRRDLQKAALAWAAGIVAALSAGSALAANPSDKVFTIANYPVEARAKDAVAAKEKAHAEGQQAALGSLLKRLVPVTAYNRIDHLKKVSAASIIDGIAIRSESNSSTQYIASLDFSFEPDAVRDMLRREGVPFVDVQAPKTVLVPLMSDPDATVGPKFRAASNAWNEAWKGLDLDNTLTPLRLETLMPTIPPATIQSVLAGGEGIQQGLAGEYKSNYVVLAAAEIDTPGKSIVVTVAGQDPAGPFVWKRSYRINNGDVAYTLELASVITLGVIEGRWKVARSQGLGVASDGGSGGSGTDVELEVQFSSLSEWNDLRGQLLDLPGVDDVRVGAVSARSAGVSLRYPGGGQSLAATLSQKGLSMTSSNNGPWLVRNGY